MKRLTLLTLLLFLLIGKCFAQQNVVAKFIVTDAKANGKDITSAATGEGEYLIFYTVPNDSTIFFANVLLKDKRESYGPTYEMQSYTTPHTATDYETDHVTFKWSYTRSTDQFKGIATVKLLKIGKPNGVAFELTIMGENFLEYKGYMDGTLKL